ncbi:MAG: hypothetical protein HYU81_00345 [Candidatus Brennerbacteria bacterium]|nr:hypothetical protein [Candidatus Brennerbacteria bacterium]
MFFRAKKIPVPERFVKPLAWATLVLALTVSFAAGYFFSRNNVPVPIIIEKSSGIK